jgi:hypothetical protein
MVAWEDWGGAMVVKRNHRDFPAGGGRSANKILDVDKV